MLLTSIKLIQSKYVAESITTDCRTVSPIGLRFCYVFAQDEFAPYCKYTKKKIENQIYINQISNLLQCCIEML